MEATRKWKHKNTHSTHSLALTQTHSNVFKCVRSDTLSPKDIAMNINLRIDVIYKIFLHLATLQASLQFQLWLAMTTPRQEAAFYKTKTCDSLNHAWNSIISAKSRQVLQHLTAAHNLGTRNTARLKMIINELKTFKTFFFSSSERLEPAERQKSWDKLIKNIPGWLFKWRDVYKEIISDISTIFLSVLWLMHGAINLPFDKWSAEILAMISILWNWFWKFELSSSLRRGR